ncbi:hypothetical protein Q1695_009500 [Nippostrongylus brasiliensis]|nr:hypothetical protein Q1695_009500 [Nippostrongylus brasiliensis]
MLAARGVSLGLGKINLSDLNQLPADKHRASQLKREEKANRPRIVIKKKADAKLIPLGREFGVNVGGSNFADSLTPSGIGVTCFGIMSIALTFSEFAQT